MRPTAPLRLRARVILFLAATLAVLGALLAWHLARDRKGQVEIDKAKLIDEARLIAVRQQVLVERADAILNGLMLSPTVSLDAPAALCSARLAALLGRETAYVQAGVARPNGDVGCAAVAPKTPVNLADRDWFQRTLNARDIVVGDVVVSKIVGKPGITLSKARRAEDGQVTAVYYVGLGLEWMAEAMAGNRLQQEARLSVMDGRGAVVARFPDPEQWTGSAATGPIATQVLAAPGAGALEEVNRAGERRLIAHVPLLTTSGGTKYHLLLTIPKRVVAAPAQRDALIAFGAFTLALLAMAAAALWGLDRWVLRPMVALARTADRQRAGERHARSGLAHDGDEIGTLARALDESSAAIEDREHRLAYANRALRVMSAGNRTLLHGHDERALLTQMCRAIVDAGGFRIAWIGYAESDKQVRLMASCGAEPGLLEGLHVTWDESAAGKGPVGRAIRLGTLQVWTSASDNPDDGVWQAGALARGCAATLTLPLRLNDAVIGILNICAAEPDVFDPGVIEVLGEAAGDLALGIRLARAEDERRKVEDQLAQHREHLEELVEQRTASLAVAKDAADVANRSKSAFLANMSHEIRTPMNAIIGLTHLMARDTRDALQRDRLSKVDGAAKHLLQIINDVLDLSKIEAGKMALDEIEFSRDEVLSSAFEMVRVAANAKGLELILDVDHLPSRMHGDPTRLTQILVNLLTNAVKFTERGWIRMRGELMEEDGDRLLLRFEVQDSGMGIPPERQGALFGAFEQGDVSTTRQHGGTGLGLALTRHIAGVMGGEAGLSSQPGAGSTFWFTGWVRRADQAAPAGRAGSVAGLRALLVDDRPEALTALTESLTLLGLRVDAHLSGAAAVRRVQAEAAAGRTFDVMLIDWCMDEMDGIETAREVRHALGDGMAPCILVTAYNEEEMREQAREARFDGFLTKPVTPSALLDALLRVLRHDDAKPAESPLLEGQAESELRRRHSGRRILLAEDNPINQEVAKELLTSVGLRVEVAVDGQQAVERAIARAYDLVLMDMQMPRLDGLKATRQIRERVGPSLPIIAMTANAFGEDRAASMQAGMNDHISKPVDPGALYATILRWLPPPKAVAPAGHREADAATVPPTDVRVTLIDRLAAVERLDVTQALHNVGGQQDVMVRVLRSFVRSYAEGAPGLTDPRPVAGRLLGWRATCHSLRGACSVIGAAALERMLTRFEHGLVAADAGAADEDAFAVSAGQIQAELLQLVGQLKTALGPTS